MVNESKSVRILMTADTVGGLWQYSVDLITQLADRGVEVLLATLGPPPSEAQRQQISGISNCRISAGKYALEWMPAPWPDVESSGSWLLNLAADFQPDVIHLGGYAHASLGWNRPVVVVAHSCVYSWWRAVHRSAPGGDWSEYHRRVRDGLERSDVVVCPSRTMAAALQAEYGITHQKLMLIHNFNQAPIISPEAKQPFFLAAGRFWDEAKNLTVLAQIADKLTWPVLVAGESGKASGKRVSGSLHLLGRLSHAELLQRMSAASVFAHPALYEPFGLAVLEAARARCVLALSDIPSLRELWEGAAVFIDPRDPDQWIYELSALSNDAGERERLALQANRRARRFQAETAVDEYLKLYKSLIARAEVAAA